MSLRILLVFPEARTDLANEIRTQLEGLAEADFVIRKNVNDALACLREQQFQLVIAYVHLPQDKGSPVNSEAQLGLAFFQNLQQDQPQMAGILVAPARIEPLSQAVQQLDKVRLAQVGENFYDVIEQEAHKCLGKVTYQAPEPPPPHKVQEPTRPQGSIEIKLHLRPGFTPFVYTEYSMSTEYGKNVTWSGDVDLDWKTLKELAKKSKELEHPEHCPQWLEDLKYVGESLWKELCGRYSKFRDHFKDHVQHVDGIENTRIRFKMDVVDKKEDEALALVSREMQAVVLEALMDDQKKFLMLQAPIYRRLNLPSFEGEYPLFDPRDVEESINCLIIEADTSGWVPLQKEGQQTQDIKLGELQHIKGDTGEPRLLEKYLRRQAHKAKIGKVLRIALEPKDLVPSDRTFKEWVFEVLENQGPWELIHYAGHSYYDERGIGYVFFPGKGTAEAVRIDEFSLHLRNTQVRFAYLSSCQSSGDDFVFQMANNQVPAILGFRWRIEDEPAKEYALKFYQSLFQHHSLEQGFLEARRYVYKKHQNNQIWASPLLILQSP